MHDGQEHIKGIIHIITKVQVQQSSQTNYEESLCL